MKRAFTLIELLVVIAIIAILAAILFPVFAQAKESAKVTVVISNTKQTATAMVMYSSDYEDTLPLAMGKRPAGGAWGCGLLHPFPADNLPQDATWSTQPRIDMANTMWANSIQPYTKNYELMEVKGLTDYSVAGDVPRTQARACLTMNGLLHAYSLSSVNAPSAVPLLWPGEGSVNVKGRATMNPALNCGTADDCHFNPSGAPSSVLGTATTNGNDSMFGVNQTTSVWTFSRRRAPFARTDTSAKAMIVGRVIKPNVTDFKSGALSDPWAAVAADGTAATFYQCSFGTDSLPTQTPAAANYTCYFRPDRPQ